MSLFTSAKIGKVAEKLKTTRKITIISHFNPDGDAVGSSLALYQYFIREGYEVRVVLPNPVSAFLCWMPGMEKVIIAERAMKTAERALADADMLFVVDMNASHRSGTALHQ